MMPSVAACLLSLCVLAQPVPRAASADLDAWRLAHQIMLLVQINQLRLSRDQVLDVLKAYDEARLGEQQQSSGAEAELKRLKDRLLRGENVRWRELRDAMSLLRSPLRGRERWEKIGKLADRVIPILQEWQIALLASNRDPLAALARLRRKGGGEADVLAALLDVDPDAWPEYRDKLAKRIAGAAGDEQAFAAARDFLDRVRKMDEQTVRAKAPELAAELQTLVPEDIPALVLIAPIDQTLARRRLMMLLADPALPEVLRELAETRGWTSAGD